MPAKTASGALVKAITSPSLGVTIKQVFDGAGHKVYDIATSAASVSPDHVNGSGYSRVNITINTSATTASGGTAYSWSKLTGDANWSIVSATSATTTFRRTACVQTSYYDATFACALTLADGSVVTSATVYAHVENTYDSGGGGSTL